jgi:hypothetical protein
MQNARNIVMDISAPRERIQMAFKAKERVEAETLENPEMFVRNSLGRFGGKGVLGRDGKHGSEDPPLQGAGTASGAGQAMGGRKKSLRCRYSMGRE